VLKLVEFFAFSKPKSIKLEIRFSSYLDCEFKVKVPAKNLAKFVKLNLHSENLKVRELVQEIYDMVAKDYHELFEQTKGEK